MQAKRAVHRKATRRARPVSPGPRGKLRGHDSDATFWDDRRVSEPARAVHNTSNARSLAPYKNIARSLMDRTTCEMGPEWSTRFVRGQQVCNPLIGKTAAGTRCNDISMRKLGSVVCRSGSKSFVCTPWQSTRREPSPRPSAFASRENVQFPAAPGQWKSGGQGVGDAAGATCAPAWR